MKVEIYKEKNGEITRKHGKFKENARKIKEKEPK